MSELLTVDELRGYIPDTADDETTLQQRLDDTEAELNRRFGVLTLTGDPAEIAEITETVYARGLSLAALHQEPAEITTVIEYAGTWSQELVADDYRIRGNYLERAAGRWPERIVVTYKPLDARAARRRVLVKLIQLDMSYSPGMRSQAGGPWSESYSTSYNQEREDIFATLDQGELFA